MIALARFIAWCNIRICTSYQQCHFKRKLGFKFMERGTWQLCEAICKWRKNQWRNIKGKVTVLFTCLISVVSTSINPKSTGLLVPIKHWGVPCPPPVKFDPDNLEEWNVESWQFISCSTKYASLKAQKYSNDVILTSLLKQLQNSDLRETKQIIYHSRGFDKSYPKCTFNWIWAIAQKLWAFLSNVGMFYQCPLTKYDYVTTVCDSSCKFRKF